MVERPYTLTLVSVALACAATGGLLWWAGDQPEVVLIGQSGRHDSHAGEERLASCLDCHVPFIGTPGTRCLSPGCHGALASGAPPRGGKAMPIRYHVALVDEPCVRCHREHGVTAEVLFTHEAIPAQIRADCRRCHSGASAPAHSRTDDVECQRCHREDEWGGRVEHAELSDLHCDTCHVAPSDSAHQALAGTCSTCHQVDHWTPAALPGK